MHVRSVLPGAARRRLLPRKSRARAGAATPAADAVARKCRKRRRCRKDAATPVRRHARYAVADARVPDAEKNDAAFAAAEVRRLRRMI